MVNSKQDVNCKSIVYFSICIFLKQILYRAVSKVLKQGLLLADGVNGSTYTEFCVIFVTNRYILIH